MVGEKFYPWSNKMRNKGQSIMEYAIIIGIVVIALSAMQVYVRRGIQATIKVAADQLGPQEYAVSDQGEQRESKSEIDTETTSTQRVRLLAGGSQRIDINETTRSSGEAISISTVEE